MSTLKLDSTGDLAIENNSVVILSDLAEETAQRLKTKFRFFRGEWPLDLRVGLPLFEVVFVKPANLNAIRSMFRQVVLEDEACTGCGPIAIDFDTQARSLSLSLDAVLTDGIVLPISDSILGGAK